MNRKDPQVRSRRLRRPAMQSAVFSVAIAMATSVGVCSAADSIGVSCALPYAHNGGNSDQACVGQHTVVINTTNTDTQAKITAELLGLDAAGKLIHSLTVENGDKVHLGSRVSPADAKFLANKNMTQVFAPVPLLRVTVENRGLKAVAYCSNVPYVEVVQPTGGVVSESNGNSTNVVAAVPMTNRGDLHLFVDGVDILTKVPLGNYLACTAATPCSGTTTIGGKTVGFSNVVVDVAPNINTPASNTIKATLTDLSCGGHVFRVSTTRQPGYPDKVAGSCNTDSLSKTGTSSVFAIAISDPTPGKVTPLVPTPVVGEICSGTPITSASVNGKVLPVAGQVFVPGNGTTTGDKYTVPINTTLGATDLVRDAFGAHDAPLGTFDKGSNRLAAAAKDNRGNRTFKNVIFATGSVAPVAFDPNVAVFKTAALESAVGTELEKLVTAKLERAFTAGTNTDLANAFVVGLSASGTQTLFNKLCTSPIQSPDPTINGKTPGQIFSQKVTAAIKAIPLSPISIPSPCSCDPSVNLSISSVNVGTDVSCNVAFTNGSFHVTMGLPAISVVADAKGSCKTGGDICVEGLAVALRGTASITGVKFEFDVTEGNLLGNTTSTPAYFKGTTTTTVTELTNAFGDSGISFCGASVLCDVLVTIFTFGAVDITPTIDISNVQDFSGQIGASQPDPVKLRQIKVDPTVVSNFQQKLNGDLSSVKITPSGITAGLVGHFASMSIDPTVPETPGVALTPAPVPVLPVPNAKDIFIGVSDDAINMMFASLTAAGKLQTGSPNGNGCIDTGVTVGSLLPANCDTLTLDNDLSTVGARGYCHAIKGDNCSTLVYNNPALSATDNANLTATEKGICFGAKGLPAGQTCTTVAEGNLITWGACNITPNFNLRAAQPLLFCAKGDVPPRMLFPDTGGSTSSVPAVLRIPSLSVSLVIDRDLNHQTTGAFANIPGCFTDGTPTGADCNVFSACLSLNLNFSMAFQTCSDNKPGFVPTFQDVQVLARSVGTVCGGATSPTSDSSVLEQSSNNLITIPLGSNGAGFAPPVCGAGLDLGGFVQCTAPGVLSIRTQNTFPESRDYLAITCKVQ